MTEELEPVRQLLNPTTGELLPDTLENAAYIYKVIADGIKELESYQRECVRVFSDRYEVTGDKTYRLDGYKVVLTGGPTDVYDGRELMAGLMEVGCPPEIIEEAVKFEPKVYAAKVKRLKGANPHYAEAIEQASRRRESPWRITVTLP